MRMLEEDWVEEEEEEDEGRGKRWRKSGRIVEED